MICICGTKAGIGDNLSGLVRQYRRRAIRGRRQQQIRGGLCSTSVVADPGNV